MPHKVQACSVGPHRIAKPFSASKENNEKPKFPFTGLKTLIITYLMVVMFY
jgi:hypothetical protein